MLWLLLLLLHVLLLLLIPVVFISVVFCSIFDTLTLCRARVLSTSCSGEYISSPFKYQGTETVTDSVFWVLHNPSQFATTMTDYFMYQCEGWVTDSLSDGCSGGHHRPTDGRLYDIRPLNSLLLLLGFWGELIKHNPDSTCAPPDLSSSPDPFDQRATTPGSTGTLRILLFHVCWATSPTSQGTESTSEYHLVSPAGTQDESQDDSYNNVTTTAFCCIIIRLLRYAIQSHSYLVI